MLHMHVTSWILGLILFLVALFLYKQGNEKGGKIVHMILRLFYLIIIFTGGYLLFDVYLANFSMPMGAEAITKGLAGIWLIAAMEMLLVKTTKGKPVAGWWAQLIIALILVLVLGYIRLPL
ncbi:MULTISPECIES: YisL family protein [unclassified Oceanobacillus]|uniref:YisL family protein n=1 Tax=unclassified Oceanobacillus TaxID=2630292 RepID=UPI00300DDD77